MRSSMLSAKPAPASSVRWSGFSVTLPLHQFQDSWYARVDAGHRAEIRLIPIFCLDRRPSCGGRLSDGLVDQLALRQRGLGDLLVVPLLAALSAERFLCLIPLPQADGGETERPRARL